MSEYIERKAALIANCYFCSAQLKDESPCDEKCANYMKLMEIPAADVRPVVRGVWVKNGWSIRCSICGYDMPFATRNFCPNCGAVMEKS